MTPQEKETLFSRYARHECTSQEEDLVHALFNEILKDSAYPETIAMGSNTMADDWDRLKIKMEQWDATQKPQRRVMKRRVAIVAAAATIAGIAFGLFYYHKATTRKAPAVLLASKEITFHQSDKDYILPLPDGSIAYLNAKSSITFTEGFAAGKRLVTLVGEGYFEVTPDPDRPFIVQTNSQTVKVIGTKFNVNSYDSNAIQTTLLDGAVQITTAGDSKDTVTLKPKDQATLSPKGFKVKQVDANSVIAWKEFFVFDQISARQALKELGMWYNKAVDSSRIPVTDKVEGSYVKNLTLPELLKELSNPIKKDLILRNDTITVK